MATRKVGRSAKSSKFIGTKAATRRKSTSVVETVRASKPPRRKAKR